MDKYTKGEVLGKGTFGTVVKATHKEVRVRPTVAALYHAPYAWAHTSYARVNLADAG